MLNDYTFSFVHTDYYDETGNVDGGRLIFDLMTEELVSLKGRIDDVEAAERLCAAFAMPN